jgi:transcriptional regulator
MTFYIPRHFRVDDTEALARFVAQHAFATLVSPGAEGLAVTHLPFVSERTPQGGLRLLGHVARANPHWQSLEGAPEVLAIFAGPHAYVSPTWYVHHPSVPTWNYAVVHARGRARLLPEAELAALLERLSDTHERGRPAPWRMSGLPADYKAGMLNAIVGFEIAVTSLEGKFKLSQNRRPEDIAGVSKALEDDGQGALSALMREHAALPGDSR